MEPTRQKELYRCTTALFAVSVPAKLRKGHTRSISADTPQNILIKVTWSTTHNTTHNTTRSTTSNISHINSNISHINSRITTIHSISNLLLIESRGGF